MSETFFTLYYSKSHGGIEWSAAFKRECETRTGSPLKRFDLYYNRYHVNDVQRQIITDLGVGAFKGEDVGVKHIPHLFRNYVDISEYDGCERVRVDVPRAKGDALDRYMNSKNRAVLEADYNEICRAEQEYQRLNPA